MLQPAPQKPTGNSSIDNLLQHCHRRRYPPKTGIIYAGDQSDALYYIIEGSVTVPSEATLKSAPASVDGSSLVFSRPPAVISSTSRSPRAASSSSTGRPA